MLRFWRARVTVGLHRGAMPRALQGRLVSIFLLSLASWVTFKIFSHFPCTIYVNSTELFHIQDHYTFMSILSGIVLLQSFQHKKPYPIIEGSFHHIIKPDPIHDKGLEGSYFSTIGHRSVYLAPSRLTHIAKPIGLAPVWQITLKIPACFCTLYKITKMNGTLTFTAEWFY